MIGFQNKVEGFDLLMMSVTNDCRLPGYPLHLFRVAGKVKELRRYWKEVRE